MIKFGPGNLRIPKFQKPVYIVAGGLTDFRKRYPEKNTCELCTGPCGWPLRRTTSRLIPSSIAGW